MIIYVAFDDTDTLDCGRGTGKLARWFPEALPDTCRLTAIVRQQLLVADDIPYTSHNSSLTCLIEAPDASVIPVLIERGAAHIKKHFVEGSDPGLCVIAEDDPAIRALKKFGKLCLVRKVTQAEAHAAVGKAHLSGHGGTNDGVIGAAAGVGLTALGDSGRLNEWIEPGFIRGLPQETTAGFLREKRIEPMAIDKNAAWIPDTDLIDNRGWLRPNWMRGRAVLPVLAIAPNRWQTLPKKKGDEG